MLCLAGGRTGLGSLIEYSALVSEAPNLTLELFVLKQPHLCIGKMDGLLSSLALQLYLRVVVEGWSSVCCCLSSKLKPLYRSLSWQNTSNRNKNILSSDTAMSAKSETCLFKISLNITCPPVTVHKVVVLGLKRIGSLQCSSPRAKRVRSLAQGPASDNLVVLEQGAWHGAGTPDLLIFATIRSITGSSRDKSTNIFRSKHKKPLCLLFSYFFC